MIKMCTEPGCHGKIDKKAYFLMQHPVKKKRELVFACKKCGRLHWPDNHPVSDDSGTKKAFLKGLKVVLV